MELSQIDDRGCLFISPAIDDWAVVEERGIGAVIDLEGGLDRGVPTIPDGILYVYLPILDADLPDPGRLQAVARLGASLVGRGERVLSHCGLGYNRSALVAGRILVELGWSGREAVERLRERRPGALFNEVFADHLESLPPGGEALPRLSRG